MTSRAAIFYDFAHELIMGKIFEKKAKKEAFFSGPPEFIIPVSVKCSV